MIVTLIQKSEDSEQRSDIEGQTDNHFDPRHFGETQNPQLSDNQVSSLATDICPSLR